MSVSVQTCPKRKLDFDQVLYISVSFTCRNIEIFKIYAENGKKKILHKNTFFSKSLKIDLLLQKLS